MSHEPTDPRLTAYALDEMPAEERAAFEAGLDAADRAEIAAVRALAALLREGLAEEPMPSLGESQREVIRRHAAGAARRRLVWLVWLAAAACFAVLLAVFRPVPGDGPVLATSRLAEGESHPDDGLAKVDDAPVLAEAREEETMRLERFSVPPADSLAEPAGRELPQPSPAPSPATETTGGELRLFTARQEEADAPPQPPARSRPARRMAEAVPEAAAAPTAGLDMGMMGMGMAGAQADHFGGGPAAVPDHPFLATRRAPTSQFAIVAPRLGETAAEGLAGSAIEEQISLLDGGPAAAGDRLAVEVALAECPWAPAHWLARVRVRGRDLGGATVRVDFAADRVASHRLLGRGERIPAREDGGATVLYELIPAAAAPGREGQGTVLTATLRREAETATAAADGPGELDGDFALAAAAAAFGLVRDGSPLRGEASWELVEELIRLGDAEPTGVRRAFLEQVRQARRAGP